MFALAALSMVLAAAPASRPSPDCGAFTCRYFDTPQKAFAQVLESRPLVLGIGEYHEVESGPRVPSAMKRFTQRLLPLLKGRAADLIAETWITNKQCRAAVQATEQLEKTTERPAETEDEVVTMLKGASALGIEPHILVLECEDYEDLLDAEGVVDNLKALQMVTRLVQEKTEAILAKLGPENQKAVVIYGGALHNDLTPAEDYAEFSFGPHLKQATNGRYVQLGLYVPEFVERDEETRKAAWFPYFEKHVSTQKTLLISLSPEAHLLVFPRTPAPKPRPKAK